MHMIRCDLVHGRQDLARMKLQPSRRLACVCVCCHVSAVSNLSVGWPIVSMILPIIAVHVADLWASPNCRVLEQTANCGFELPIRNTE
jgi:hypothetical protein